MNRTSSRLLRLVTVAALSAGVFAGVPGAARADSGYGYCWQSGCNGKDPVNEDCAVNATTVKTLTVGTGYEIELRYSPDCDANWVRVLTARAEPFFVENANRNTAKYSSVAGVSSWSDMVDGSVHAWGCLQIPSSTNSNGYTAAWVSDSGQSGTAWQYPNCPTTA